MRPRSSTRGRPSPDGVADDAVDAGGRGRRAAVSSAGCGSLDFSAFVAGPLGAQVLADLGAEVIKVEPPEGEAMRAAAYAVAACQRGKRSLALDIGAPPRRVPSSSALIKWADVVLHNFRVGRVRAARHRRGDRRRLNPRAVYCHASAFGTDRPPRPRPGNDALDAGGDRASSGPSAARATIRSRPRGSRSTWPADGSPRPGSSPGSTPGPTSGRGQQVATSLLGAGMLLQSGVFQRDGEFVRGPELDADQTGYGPGYRIYEAGDGGGSRSCVPDAGVVAALRVAPRGGGAARRPTRPLRGGADDADAPEAEAVLEPAFATAPARRLGGAAAGRRGCWPSASPTSTATRSAGASSTTR